ncbi:MAG TPA: hypothetical protein QF624_04325 [Dehalococcoidia bacterium]|jgi:hypothetical protein|nr:hypothetical protein [Dehalococcoidia bacterium]
MKVKILPTVRRPDVGKSPTHENRRAWLPQQTRFCPVVEDLDRLGFLVYPPLANNETLQLYRRDDDVLVVTFYTANESGLGVAFVVEVPPGGTNSPEVTSIDAERGFDETSALELLDAVAVDLNGPAGTFGLRGASNFITEDGWDCVYTAVFNEIARPAVPSMVTRIETDRVAHETTFHIALHRGEVMSAAGGGPIGQVFFIPREEVLIADGSPDEEQRFATVQREYWDERATKEKTTNYGATFTYQYRDHQKARRADPVEAPLQLLQDASPSDG